MHCAGERGWAGLKWILVAALAGALTTLPGCEDTQKIHTQPAADDGGDDGTDAADGGTGGSTDAGGTTGGGGTPATPFIENVNLPSGILWGTTVSGSATFSGEPGIELEWEISNPNGDGAFTPNKNTTNIGSSGLITVNFDYVAPDSTGFKSFVMTVTDANSATDSVGFDLSVGRSGVALFADGTYVDYSPGSFVSEASCLEESMVNMGYDVLTFTGTSYTELDNALTSRAVLAIPHQAFAEVVAGMDAATQNRILDFVQLGGTLLVIDDGYWARSFINTIFGHSLDQVQFGPTPPIDLNTTDVAGTPFQDGPSSISSNTSTWALEMTTIPLTATTVYPDYNGDGVVTLIPEGAGNILLLGWNWFDAYPTGGQDNGWLPLLDIGLSAAEDETL